MAPLFRVIAFPITTAADGTATVDQADNHVNGLIWEVMYVPGTIATGATVTLTVRNSAVTKTILTQANAGTSTLILYPRGNAAGSTGTVGSDGMQFIPVVGQLRVAVASGGSGGVGNLYVTVAE